MASTISFGPAGWSRIGSGMQVLAKLTASTLGPSGRRVLIEQPFAAPKFSASGYEIAQTLDLADPVQNAGVRLLRQVAWSTKDAVGDGTATAIVMAHAMIAAAAPAVVAGVGAAPLRRALVRAGETVMGALERAARPCSGEAELISLASRAAGDDADLGSAIGRAVHGLKPDGVVIVEESKRREDLLAIQRGMHFSGGYLSSHFATDREGGIAILDEPYLLIADQTITTLEAIVPALNALAGADKALVIIAGDVSGDALATLVVNKQRSGCKLVAAMAPGFGRWRRPMLEDIAIATGGTVVASDRGTMLQHLRPDMLGRARQVRVERDATTIVEGAGDVSAIAQRCDALRREIARERYLSFDRERHQERLARLTSGVATLQVAGATPIERADRADAGRVAAAAARAASRDGVVPGGGAALLHAAHELGRSTPAGLEERVAAKILRRALAAPGRCIAENARADGRRIVAALIDGGNASLAFDAVAGDVVDAWDADLLDPLSVVSSAFHSALSVAIGMIGFAGAIVRASPSKSCRSDWTDA